MAETAGKPVREQARPVATVSKSGRRLRRISFRVARILLLAYLGLLLVVALLQNWIIFPGASTQGKPEAVVHPPPGCELVRLKTDAGVPIVAFFGPAQSEDGAVRADAARCPTLIYFYGNGMCLADADGEFHRFRRLGLNVVIPEFVGYGMSGGKPSEAGIYATAEAAYEHVVHRGDVDPRKIIAGGWSLGAAAAIDLASNRPVAGLITFDGFTSVKDEAHYLYPWLPTSLILKYRFDNERKMRQVACPTLIVHGTHDELVPFSMGNRLAAATYNARLYPVPGGRHNTIFEDGGEALWGQIARFVERLR